MSRRILIGAGAVAVVVVIAIVAVIILDGSEDSSSNESAGQGATGADGRTRKGGTIVVGAEEDFACADWIGSCSGARWGRYSFQEQTIPRVFDFAKKNGVWTEVPNVVLAGEPVVAMVDGKQTVTYTINPAAVWSDGEPITSTDFKYTVNEFVNGPDVYDPSGYNQIESVDDTDPKTAVVTFSETFGAWKALFGAAYGIMPSHILQGKDRATEMADGYSWSGGPWIADWSKGVDVTLTPNPNWYGEKPKLDKVIFEIQANTAAEFKAFRNGESLAIYPAATLDAIAAIPRKLEGIKSSYTADGNIEALWINNAKPPFDSKAVRQAFAYAIDRDAIVKRLYGAINITKAVNTINPPIQYAYSDPNAWAKYRKDLAQVKTLMAGDGWAKNSNGIWAKNGQTAKVEINSTSGDTRREVIEQALQAQLRAAGFDLTIENAIADDLWPKLQAGDYQVALYAQDATSAQPNLCVIFCTENIPGPANGDAGQNWGRVRTVADDALLEVEASVDDPARMAAGKMADQILAEDQVALPLDPLPDILLWSTKIVGPVHDDPVLGMFSNLHHWALRK